MNGDLGRIRDLLRAARRRWFWHTVFGAVARALAAAGLVVTLAWAVARLGGPHLHGGAVAALAAGALVAIAASAAWAAWPLRRRPTDVQVARFVEEHCPQLEDRLVTAVESASRPAAGQPPAFASLLYRDAAGRADDIDLDAAISGRAVLRRGVLASSAAVALAAVVVLAWPDARTALGALRQAAFPPRVALHVMPGDARVMADTAFTVRARVGNLPRGATPTIVAEGERGRVERPMSALNGQGDFSYTFQQVTDAFRYGVRAASAQSSQYRVTVFRPARVARIDVRYEYPAGYGLPTRLEKDGGDVYGPPGTRVQLSVTTDKPVREGVLAMADGTKVALSANGERALTGNLRIADDGSYRVALLDGEGLRNPGETEYFIRVIADSPPDVRIVKPAADRQVTPLEEVPIAAHADDDHGVRDFDLVYSVRGGPERRLPFAVRGDSRSIDGARVLYLEDLGVRPGDFVTYYASARDNAPGKGSAEARSDIFFLEVTAFDDEFVPPQSQAPGSAGAGASGRSLDDLIRAQKAIVVATWKLDRRSVRSRSARSDEDLRTVARAQGELKKRALEAGGTGLARAARNGAPGGGDAMANAVEAMGQAEESLNAGRTSDALPHETRALNELMRAQASQRRKQLMQASGGGSGNDAGSNHDLSTMFDRELQRQQKTSYELPQQNQSRQEREQSDVLDRLRQLAARQGELSQRQQDLERDRARMQADEFKRQLERLTREQSELRQQAEQLAEQMRAKSGQGQTGRSTAGRGGRQGGASSGSGGAESEMRKASDAMREAAARLRSGKLGEAGRQGQQALGSLKSAEDEVRRRQGGDASGSELGDLQMEAQRVADAQRQIAEQAAAAGTGRSAGDAMRRLAGEKERLADQVEQLQKGLKSAAASRATEGRQRQALEGASADFEHLPKRMRDSAAAMRDPAKGDVNRPESAAREAELAKTLDRLAERLAKAAGSAGAPQASERLARTRDIKERLARLEQEMRDLQRQSGARGRMARGGEAQEGGGRGAVGTSGGQGDASLARLREQYQRELQRASEHLDDLRRAGAVGTTPEGQGRQILSARGYNQDFSRWEQLSHGINAGLDRAETELSERLREQQARDRLPAPSGSRAPESYRRLVEKYYQALAGNGRK